MQHTTGLLEKWCCSLYKDFRSGVDDIIFIFYSAANYTTYSQIICRQLLKSKYPDIIAKVVVIMRDI